MKTASYVLLAARLWFIIILGSCASCSSILQASRLDTPDAAIVQPGSSFVERSQPKEWLISSDGQRVVVPLLSRPTTPAPIGGQWVFVVKESQANGQFNGYWIIVPAGEETNVAFPR